VLASCTSNAHFGYTDLPSGYHWRALYDHVAKAVVFYGRDPLTLDTVYVGPDGQFYIFHHAGMIQARDLRRHWTPHDVP
jgi:hypothetical protein